MSSSLLPSADLLLAQIQQVGPQSSQLSGEAQLCPFSLGCRGDTGPRVDAWGGRRAIRGIESTEERETKLFPKPLFEFEMTGTYCKRFMVCLSWESWSCGY